MKLDWRGVAAAGGLLAASCSAHVPSTLSYAGEPVLSSREGSPSVAFRILFRSGSVDDPPSRHGLTALAARVMAEGGTVKLPPAELLRALFPMAADLAVQVDKEQTVFVGRAPREQVARFVEILTDVLLTPRWDAKEFERIRDEMVSDIVQRLRTSDDESLSKEALASWLYKGHPYGHFTYGSVHGLRAATLEETRAHAVRVFGRSRLVVGLGGAVRPDDPAIRTLGQRLSQLPAGEPLRGRLPVPSTPPTKVLLVDKDTASTAFDLGYAWDVDRSHPDWPALVVAFSALGEHRQAGGRLYVALRERRGLNYGDYAYPEHFIQSWEGKLPLVNIARHQQDVTIWLRPVEHKNRLFALRAALSELRRFAKQGLTAAEVERTKKFLAGYTRLWDLTDLRRVGYELDERFYGTPKYIQSLRERIARLTPTDVNGAITRHFDPGKLTIAVVTKDAAAMRDAIVSGKPTPIEYPSPKPSDVLAEDKTIAEAPWGIGGEQIRILAADQLFEE